MNVIKADLPKGIKQLKLIAFADWHLADPHCDLSFIQKQIEQVKNEPNTYCICNGDLLNFALKNSVSDVYSSMLTPQQQIDRLVSMLEPIKDKIIAYSDGNHENRLYKDAGINIGKYICAMLGITDRYFEDGAIVFIRFGQCSRRASDSRKTAYSIYVKHGSGGGKREGGKANALADMAAVIDADCYIHSHTHMPLAFPLAYFRTCIQNSSIQEVNKLFVNASAALRYGGYGEKFGFKPSARANVAIYFDGSKRGMEAHISV